MATAKWLGTASLELEQDGEILLIDPHLSRLNKRRTFLHKIRPDEEKIDRYLGEVKGQIAGILVTHAHHDHLMDAPYLAQKLGVPVWGNESVDTFMRLHGLPGCPLVLQGGERFNLGPFEIEPIKTRHGLVMAGRVPFPGQINPHSRPPLWVWEYRHGMPPLAVLVSAGGQTLFHLGTANIIDNLLPRRAVDSAWLCISGYNYTPQFCERIADKIKAKRFIPFHFEDFSAPLAGKMSYIPGCDPKAYKEKQLACAPGVEVIIPKPYETIPL